MNNKKIIISFFILFLIISLYADSLRPIRDNVGFCWQKNQLTRLINVILKYKEIKKISNKSPIIGGISPHDDFLYAGHIYLPLFKALKAKEIVIFGVAHSIIRKNFEKANNRLIFDSFDHWTGLDGKNIKISDLRESLVRELPQEYFIIEDKAHQLEHSIEALIPFLDYFNPGFKLTPIIVCPMDMKSLREISNKTAEILFSYIQKKNLIPGKDIVFLISADANHYGSDFENTIWGLDYKGHKKGINRDKRIVERIISGLVTEQKIKDISNSLWKSKGHDYLVWCGKYSIPFGMQTIERVLKRTDPNKNVWGRLIRYEDTYSAGVLPLKDPGFGITAPFSFKHWVGFFSLYFEGILF